MCPLPFVLLNLESVERKGKNYKNLNILRTKSFFDEIKNVFKGLSFGEKISFLNVLCYTMK